MIDTANSVLDAIYRLGFSNLTDLTNNGQGLSPSELYSYADDAAKLLSYQSGIFATFDSSITVVGGTSTYTLPASHVFTLVAWVGTQILRVTRVADLWALDSAWSTTTGAPKRCSLDAGSVGTITLYPQPVSGGTLYQICQEYPGTVAQGSSTLGLPTVLGDYITYAMLAGARGGEWSGVQQEMADHYRQRMDMYEEIITHLWGAGE